MILTRQHINQIFSAHPKRLERILRHESDLYDELVDVATPTSKAGVILRQLIGRENFGKLPERVNNPLFRVSSEEAREAIRMYKNYNFIDQDQALVALIRTHGLGRIIESDHLIEQRFIDTIENGNFGFDRDIREVSVRNRERVKDTYAIATAKNEITYYRLSRRIARIDPDFRMAGLYPHTGPGSKTTRLSQFIPWGTESTHSLKDIANAHRYVLQVEMGLPDSIEGSYLYDLAHAVEFGIENNDLDIDLDEILEGISDSGTTTDRLVRYFRQDNLSVELFSPTNWTRYREIEWPKYL